MMFRYLLLLLSILSWNSNAQTPKILWQFDTKDMAFGQAAAADVDGDGKLEIAFANYRNDSNIYVLNAEDGSLYWKYNTGGCNDVAPLIYDVDKDGDLEIILPGSCNPETFCFDADSGFVQWRTRTRGSDSPPTIADLDGDGTLEILHGEFGGYVRCINAEDGTTQWHLLVDPNSWIQTAPIIIDADKDGQLDFVVANWNFGSDHRVFCYRGDSRALLWSDTLPEDYMYHGASWADLDKDGYIELVIGDYEGNLLCYNAENGSLNWRYKHPISSYAGAATSIADLNDDGRLEIVYLDGSRVIALNDTGGFIWSFTIPSLGQAFRGTTLADINDDKYIDVSFGASNGIVYALDGKDGSIVKSLDLAAHYGKKFDIRHGAIIADFNKDDTLDIFVVGGHAEYPAIQNNYGRAYALSWGKGQGPEWKMFRRDPRRSGCVCNDSLLTGAYKPLERSVNSSFVLYPNPGSQFINLVTRNPNLLTGPIEVLDLKGKKIRTISSEHFLNQGVLRLDISDLQSGVFLLRIPERERNHTLRFIKI